MEWSEVFSARIYGCGGLIVAELNPSEAQRKAMLEWMGEVDPDDFDYEEWLDGLFAAANSIPEGAPVGTIARRPDGVFVAVRILTDYLERYWTYTRTDHSLNDDWPDPDDADSWPVIFAPNEVGSSEHSVSDGDAYDPTKPIGPEIWRLAEWLEEHDDGEPYEIYTPDGSYGYRLSASQVGRHPTAQQEPEACESCLGSGLGLGAVLGGFLETDCSDCDATGEAQQEPAASIDASHLERQREFSLKTFGPGARTNGVLDHIAKELNEIREAPEDISEWVDVIILAFDGAWRAGWEPQQIIDAIVAKQSKNEQREWPDWRTADPDKAIEHVRASEDTKPRTPRVVDRLGVDEQGSRWLDRVGDEWWYTVLSRWRYRSHIDGGAGAGNPLDMYAPYVEILEPRVLPSLDCEEARDGTVWENKYGVEVVYDRGWVFADTRVGGVYTTPDYGPYTEVLNVG